MIADLDINGLPPQLNNTVCNAFICEQFVYAGELVAPANVSYLKFSGIWHRLYFDHGTIFWRFQGEDPLPWNVPQEQWSYPHTDVGNIAGVVGDRLISYVMTATPTGSNVEFIFSSSRRIVLVDAYDISSYIII